LFRRKSLDELNAARPLTDVFFEYNLGLGDRRASVVRDYLATLGINASRIETRSLGKESPFCRGEGEACWSQNRRDHFLITGK
jgi:peptidoglycan-associated lipoprotein